MGKTGIVTALLMVMSIAVIAGIGFYIYNASQQTALDQEQQAKLESGQIAVDTLKGKPVTLSTLAYDRSADNMNTMVVAPAYVITDPVVSSTEVSGTFAADGTSLSSAARTDITAGLSVNGQIAVIAANDSWYGVWGDKGSGNLMKPTSQAENLDLYVYRAGGDINITIDDTDGNAISMNNGSVRNLTLGASEAETLEKFKIKQQTANRAYNLKGFYVSLDNSDANITSISCKDSTITGASGVSIDASTLNLLNTQNDDWLFEFSAPVLLLEFDSAEIDTLTLKADGDGCPGTAGGEHIQFCVFDINWYRSNSKNAMILGPETDAATPADVGAANVCATIRCTS